VDPGTVDLVAADTGVWSAHRGAKTQCDGNAQRRVIEPRSNCRARDSLQKIARMTPKSAVTAATIAVEHTTSVLTPATPTADHTDTLEKLNISSTAADNTVTVDLISLLQAEVQRQRELISKLQQQLCFVLTVLGVTEQEIQPTVNAGSQQSNSNSVGKTSSAEQLTNQPLWTDVVANTQHSHSYQQQKPPQHVTSFQQSIIAAVYADQSERKRRESSLIVSGLRESQTQSDKVLFTNLCRDEFDVQVDVVSTKRLGRLQPSKVRPLLIFTSKADEAQHLIAAAKQLRKSLNPDVRTSVYFNRNMTKAEAEAAYRARVQRRQATLHRTNNQQNQGARYDVSNSSDEQSSIGISLSLLNIASNPNAIVPPPPAADTQACTNDNHAPLAAVAPAEETDISYLQGRRG
jgi:hypothetical protein